MSDALVLFAHGARDAAWAEPLRRVQAAIDAAAPAARVELAFLEFMTPNLADCVAQLDAQGCRRIVVLPMFIAQGGHLKKEVPAMLAALRERYPLIAFELLPAVGEAEAVVRAMAATALAAIVPTTA